MPPSPSASSGREDRSPLPERASASASSAQLARLGPALSHSWWMALVVVATVFAAHFPALQAGFIWDDNAHVTAPALRSWEGLFRIWFEPGATQQYYPLLHSLFWFEYHLWGDHAPGYHLVNLALHAGAAVLVGFTLRRLGAPGAWLAGLLFGLHPVQVETAAWVTEQKNTLSTVLYLGAALAYLRFEATRGRASYAVALALFLLALCSKSVTATLPAALLVALWWKRGALSARRDVVPLLPWFALGAAAGIHTAIFEVTEIGAAGAAYELSALDRLVLAGRVVWFYLGKLAWPHDLTFFYPRWEIDAGSAAQWIPLLAAIAVTIALWLARRRNRAPLAAWLFFGGSLFPVLGFFNVYPFRYSYVADHFQYLPCLGVFALAAGAFSRALEQPRWRALGATAGAVVLLVLGAMSWRQNETYRTYETLLRTTIARNPSAWIALNNLGFELNRDAARRAEAIALFRRAIELKPDYYEALNNLGLALSQDGRPAEAVPLLEAAARIQPESTQVFTNLGIALATSGRAQESLAAFERAAQLSPKLPNAWENWGKALQLLGRPREAEERFREAERLRGGLSGEAR